MRLGLPAGASAPLTCSDAPPTDRRSDRESPPDVTQEDQMTERTTSHVDVDQDHPQPHSTHSTLDAGGPLDQGVRMAADTDTDTDADTDADSVVESTGAAGQVEADDFALPVQSTDAAADDTEPVDVAGSEGAGATDSTGDEDAPRVGKGSRANTTLRVTERNTGQC